MLLKYMKDTRFVQKFKFRADNTKKNVVSERVKRSAKKKYDKNNLVYISILYNIILR